MKKPYLTYALSAEGKLVHIDSVANGKECRCFCTYCGEPLQAKQGAKRKHHFSHLSGTECEAAYESMLHLLAKEKIQEAFYNRTSLYMEFEYTSFCNQDKCIFMSHSRRCSNKEKRRIDIKEWYDSCEQEISYDNIRRRSDLKFFSKEFPERKPIYIEFCVTHASDEAKLHSGNKITSNPQPIGFSGILLAKRQNSFYCTYFLHNRNVADTKSPYPIKRLEVIRWFNQKSMVFNQSLS